MEITITEKPTTPTICLNMIVKNESKIITRLFDSVINFIDTYCICDTGSTDNTVDIIKEYFKSKNISGKIVYEPFKNFAHNRNYSLQECVGLSDYVLLMDADMKLEFNNFDKNRLLEGDYFLLLQGDDHFYYQNTRIVKNNGLFKYFGVTHEYVSTPDGSKKINVLKNELFIRDIGDGGAKGDKLERDIRLLVDGIKEEPNSDRYHFYLANTYHDSGRYDEAIETYKKRIQIGGWEQEVWYSYYRIGNCYKNMNKMSDAIFYWLEGYNYFPNRLENLYEIINYYRYAGKPKSAKIFYDLCKNIMTTTNIMKDKDTFLFLHNDVYTYKLDYEYTIFASYNNIYNVNDALISVFNYCKDYNVISNTLCNMKFYKDILKSNKTIDLSLSVNKNIGDDIVKLYSSSSCIIPNKLGNGYLINIRMVNYRINEQGRYLDCEKHITTTNKYIELDKDLNKIPSSEKLFDVTDDNRLYLGIEDIRIFYKDNDLVFIGTGYHKNETIGVVVGDYNINSNELEPIEIKPSFNNSNCEKNWVYIDYKDSNHIVYKWHPLQICKINDETKELDLVETKGNMPRIFSHARGSTCGFKYKNEYWFIVHIVSYEQPRHYYHVFAVFDSEMNLLRYSAPFKFEGTCIEYTLSLIVEDDRVIVPYSVWDNKTKIAVYDKSYIDSLVKYT